MQKNLKKNDCFFFFFVSSNYFPVLLIYPLCIITELRMYFFKFLNVLLLLLVVSCFLFFIFIFLFTLFSDIFLCILFRVGKAETCKPFLQKKYKKKPPKNHFPRLYLNSYHSLQFFYKKNSLLFK